MIKYQLIFCFACLCLGCSKNSGGSDDRQTPVISFISPSNNEVFTSGQAVDIAATITDNDKLAEIHVHISNNTTAQLLVDIHRYPAAASYSLSENFTAQAGIVYKIQLVAIDKSGNQDVKSVIISTN